MTFNRNCANCKHEGKGRPCCSQCKSPIYECFKEKIDSITFKIVEEIRFKGENI